MISQPTAVKDFKRFDEFKDLGEVATANNDIASELNYILKHLSFTNMNCDILEIELPATSDFRINHSLKVIPKYRIILRQDGSGAVYDIPLSWTRDYITLHNAGAKQKITLALFKE